MLIFFIGFISMQQNIGDVPRQLLEFNWFQNLIRFGACIIINNFFTPFFTHHSIWVFSSITEVAIIIFRPFLIISGARSTSTLITNPHFSSNIIKSDYFPITLIMMNNNSIQSESGYLIKLPYIYLALLQRVLPVIYLFYFLIVSLLTKSNMTMQLY